MAADILSSLDTDYDPCEDFYDFASTLIEPTAPSMRVHIASARGWVREHPLPPGKGSVSPSSKLAKQNQLVIRNILETQVLISSNEHDKQMLRKLRGLYRSCMDENRLDYLENKPLSDVIRNLRNLFRADMRLGSVNLEKQKDYGLTAALAYLHSIGMSP
jgi:endothelin-converting enzyme